jgi:hypothetical protein
MATAADPWQHLRKKSSFDLNKHKIGEAHFFLQQIARHNELPRRPACLTEDGIGAYDFLPTVMPTK